MMLSVYRAATWVAMPVARLYLAARMARGKEDPARFAERLGRPGLPRPDGPLIWLHAASVGESLSLLPLMGRLLAERPGFHALLTTGTVTSARLMADRLPEGAFHQYVPVDRRKLVRRFLDHWRPDLVLWAESEFWPNLVTEPAARGIPLILVNGRVSPRSARGWRKAGGLIAALLSGFTLCLGQTADDAERLRRLGAPQSKYLGNLKFAAPPLPADPDALDGLAARLGDRPRWLAASTHAGEERVVARVHRRLRDRRPRLLTFVVPRHPERGPDVARTLRREGLTLALRSAGEPIGDETEAYVADTMGELGVFYRLVEIVFMGKSLVPLGGQNPLEPARLGCAVIHGPHMGNFEDIVRRMAQGGGAEEVTDEETLTSTVERLLEDGRERALRIAAGAAFAAAEADVLDALVSELGPFLDAVARDRRAGA